MKIKELKSFSDKLFGLAFKDKISPVYFRTRFGIHTFFVKHPITVVICDNDFVVKKIFPKVMPWRVVLWNPKYYNVIEYPSGYKPLRHVKAGYKVNINKF